MFRYGKYQDDGGWFEPIVLPHPETNRLYKWLGKTIGGDGVKFWTVHRRMEQAKLDFEQHHEPLKSLEFEKEGIPFSELPCGHNFTFTIPDYAGNYLYRKTKNGTVKALVIQPPEFTGATIVEDNGSPLFTED